MSEIKLNARQEELKQKIICLFKEIKEMLKTPSPVGMREKIDQMGQLAHELHRSLTPPPKHHRYMIKNRGLKPDHPDFYKHIHPVEDLLNYLEDDTANDDPIDQTINKKFVMKVYSRRQGHDDAYTITRIAEGWLISFLSISGACDKTGSPSILVPVWFQRKSAGRNKLR